MTSQCLVTPPTSQSAGGQGGRGLSFRTFVFLQTVEMFRKHRKSVQQLVTICVTFQEVREAPNLISLPEEEPEQVEPEQVEPEHHCRFECLSIRT